MSDCKDSKTMAALTAALEAVGIEVAEHHEGGEDVYDSLPVVVFRGDDGAGMRAVGLAWERATIPPRAGVGLDDSVPRNL